MALSEGGDGKQRMHDRLCSYTLLAPQANPRGKEKRRRGAGSVLLALPMTQATLKPPE